MRDLTDVSSFRSRLQTYQRPIDHEKSGRVPTGRTAYIQPEYTPRRCLQAIVEAEEREAKKLEPKAETQKVAVKPLLSKAQEQARADMPKPRKSRPMLTLLSLKLRDLKAWWHKSLARMPKTETTMYDNELSTRPALPRPRCKCTHYLVSTFHE